MPQSEPSITLNESIRRKLHALQTLSQKFTHDTNNFYSVLQGYVSLIEMSIQDNSEIQKYLPPMKEALASGIALNRLLSSYFRSTEVLVALVDLTRLLQEECDEFSKNHDFPIRVTVEGQINPLLLEEPIVRSTVHHLCLLAQKTQTPNANFELALEELDDDLLRNMVLASPKGRYVSLRLKVMLADYQQIEDTEFLNPFVISVDPKNDLGLAKMFRMIQNHGGNLDVTVHDQYLTLTLYFPIANK